MMATVITPLVSAAPVTATNSPLSTFPASGGWANPTNAYINGDNYASSATSNAQQKYGGYGFTIPTTSTITSVKVMLTAAINFVVTGWFMQVEVSTDGGSTFVSHAATYVGQLTTAKTVYTVDVTSWTAWTPSMINNDKIWVRVTFYGSSGFTEQLYYIPVAVTYDTGVQNVVPEVPFGTVAVLSALVVGVVVYAKRGKLPSLKSF
jgi:hypothetical protein